MLKKNTHSFIITVLAVAYTIGTTQAGYCNWGPLGTGASSTCSGDRQGGDWCNEGRHNCEDACGGRWCVNGDGIDKHKTQKSSMRSTTPLPITPTDEFCKSNSLGDDCYYSFFVPCKLTFYKSNRKDIQHFSCDSLIDGKSDDVTISVEMRKVLGWPDSCVALGPRCYSLTEHPYILNFTLFADDPEYAMPFPDEANMVSVDCSSDFAQAQEVWNNLPEELHEVATAITIFTMTALIGIIACIAAICCCCCARRRSQYTIVPEDKNDPDPLVPVHFRRYDGKPVVATRIKDDKPGYQATVV